MCLLIKNGEIVTTESRWCGDVRCRDGRIVELGAALESESGERIVDAADQLVLPGGVDPHVHMALPVMGTVSSDNFESGTAAAIAGGTTTIIDFVHPERGQNFLEALAARQTEAQNAVADYSFHMAVTWWAEEVAPWIVQCSTTEGIPSFKAYMAYKESVGLEDSALVQAMQVIGEQDGVLLVHAENGDIIEDLRTEMAATGRTAPKYHPQSRPPETEGEATTRAIELAATAGAQLYVVHITCRQALEAVAKAKLDGQKIFGETCPQYLLLDDSVYDKPNFEGAAYVIAPPIRPKRHQEALWSGLRASQLDVVATDHCPFNMSQKEAGKEDFRIIPGGAAGVEHRLTLLYTHGVLEERIDLHHFVDLISTRPAKIFGLYPRKGSISVGADADLVVWNPEAHGTISAGTHHHRCDRSIYEGFRTQGAPSTVIAAGKVVFVEGDLRVEPGSGRFLKRAPRERGA